MQNPLDMLPGKYLYICRKLSMRKSNLEALGILEETKDVTEWVNNFVIIEKKVPIDSSNSHSPGHSVKKKLRICLDPRDLNEALERGTLLHTFH